ncbi:MAG: hypothetical protein ACYDH4_10055, partial [Candidatus Cryosericum sp.]
ILVIQAGRTRRGEVQHAQEVLAEAHATLLGVVLNRARRQVNDYYYARTSDAEPVPPEET